MLKINEVFPEKMCTRFLALLACSEKAGLSRFQTLYICLYCTYSRCAANSFFVKSPNFAQCTRKQLKMTKTRTVESMVAYTHIDKTLQGRTESNLKKIPQRNRRCHFDKRDALVWKLVLFSFLIGVQARSPISQLRAEIYEKFQKW